MKRAWWIGGIVLLLAIAIAATRFSGLQGTPSGRSSGGRAAPEFTEISSWVNSAPLSMRSLRGTVVWIDFWTYSCINCIRTLPAVRAFYARYHPFGLEIVGVHSPEFDFEKKLENVRAAVTKYKVPYPVALDSKMATWRAYDNNYWPRVYLVDRGGRIRYDHAGEGGESDIEDHLRTLLAANGEHLPPRLDPASYELGGDITPEVYAGYARGSTQGSLANPEGYAPQIVTTYRAVRPEQVARTGTGGSFFLEGAWLTQDEYTEAAADGAKVVLPFRARSLYMVAAPGTGPARVSIEVDGSRTRDLVVNADDLYTLGAFPREETHVLTLVVGKGVRLYTFTFG